MTGSNASEKPGLSGLVLSGGLSRRMDVPDKGSLTYRGNETERDRCYRLLQTFCDDAFVSCRRDQAHLLKDDQQVIWDAHDRLGPAGGLLSAFQHAPSRTWLVLACDMPYVDEDAIRFLLDRRDPKADATVFRHPDDGALEPLFAIWEPPALNRLAANVEQGRYGPRKTLESVQPCVLDPPQPRWLLSVNTPEEAEQAAQELGPGPRRPPFP